MTTKLKISSKILRILAAGDRTKDFKIDEREIANDIDQLRSEMIVDEYLQNEAKGIQMIPGEYIKTYGNFALLTDNGRRYILLPARPIKFPMDKGILSIRPRDEIRESFIPMYNGHNELGGGLEAGYLENKCGYYPEGKRIYFTGNVNKLYSNNDPSLMPKPLLVRLVPDSQDIGIGDELAVSADMEKRIVAEILRLRAPFLNVTQDKAVDEIS
jgi:hypothetical protein